MNLKKKYKIATILPYKESYTFEDASAVSLWVSEFYKRSIHKNNNFIYGNANSNKYLTKNYVNIPLKNLKNKFKSTSSEYIEKLTTKLTKVQFDIIEIHNRPLVLFKLLNRINSKFIIYYHNDPLSMSGSKLISERKEILKRVDKIIFISKWVKKRFFEGLDNQDDKTEIIYHSVYNRKKKLKDKQIVFVGKLNHAKGYDIYKNAIIKILNEFPKWNALSIGNESRRNIYINHKNHNEYGFLNHKKTFDILDKSEIAVVPSRWEEPFGRVSLEATAAGCATITSNKGGLLETSKYTISIDNIDSEKLYKKIKNLIQNTIKRKKIQYLSRNNIEHLIDKNTKKIDLMRLSIFSKFKLNFIKNRLKIINLFNQGQKSNYRLFNISVGKKFTNGFIRNNHDVLEISDRDFIKNNRNLLNFKSDIDLFQKHLIDVVKNYNPDLLLF